MKFSVPAREYNVGGFTDYNKYKHERQRLAKTIHDDLIKEKLGERLGHSPSKYGEHSLFRSGPIKRPQPGEIKAEVQRVKEATAKLHLESKTRDRSPSMQHIEKEIRQSMGRSSGRHNAPSVRSHSVMGTADTGRTSRKGDTTKSLMKRLDQLEAVQQDQSRQGDNIDQTITTLKQDLYRLKEVKRMKRMSEKGTMEEKLFKSELKEGLNDVKIRLKRLQDTMKAVGGVDIFPEEDPRPNSQMLPSLAPHHQHLATKMGRNTELWPQGVFVPDPYKTQPAQNAPESSQYWITKEKQSQVNEDREKEREWLNQFKPKVKGANSKEQLFPMALKGQKPTESLYRDGYRSFRDVREYPTKEFFHKTDDLVEFGNEQVRLKDYQRAPNLKKK